MDSSFLDPDPGVFLLELEPASPPPLQDTFLPCLPSVLDDDGVCGDCSTAVSLETGAKSLSDQLDLLLSAANSCVRLTFEPPLR